MLKRFLFSLLHAAESRIFGFKSFGSGSLVKLFPRKINGARFVSIGCESFFHEGLLIFVSEAHPGVTPELVVGDRCNFGADAFISCTRSIRIGNDVLTSSRIFIGDSYHGYSDASQPIKNQPMEGDAPVVIGDGCFLGIGCVILPGVTLGRNCVVAANAVVTKSFPDHAVVAGTPARMIKRYDSGQNAWVTC